MLNLKKKILKANLGTLALGSPNTHSSIVHSLLTLIFSQKEKEKKERKLTVMYPKLYFFFLDVALLLSNLSFKLLP